jgi:hypothetical protein
MCAGFRRLMEEAAWDRQKTSGPLSFRERPAGFQFVGGFYSTAFTAGIFQVPSMIEGLVSLGQ